jgi:hypothetical protein
MARSSTTFNSDTSVQVPRRGKAAHTKLQAALEQEGLTEEDILRIYVLVGLGNVIEDPRADERGNNRLPIEFQNVAKIADKIVPSVKPSGEKVTFDFDVNATVPDKADQLLEAAAKGQISPETAQLMINSLSAIIKIDEYTELKDKIEKLAEKMGVE